MKRKHNYRYKMPLKGRFFGVLSFFVVCLTLLLTRLFYLQIIENKRYSDIAHNSRTAIVKLSGERGLILDRKLNKLVLNVPKYSVYAVPRYIDDKTGTAGQLAELLDRDKVDILRKISNDKMFVWIARKLSDDKIQQIKSCGLTGIGFIPESKRSYPNNSLAAHIIGFVDIDNNGLEGLEKYYNEELRGVDGYKVVIVDAKRRQVSLAGDRFLPPRDGHTLILTKDEVIQHIAEKALLSGVEKFHPKSASVVVMDPSNGDILALCNWPTYDLNEYINSSADEMRNRAITDILEPGSSFKIVTASAALEENIVNIIDEFYCENGSYQVAGRILHDHRPYGTLEFRDIIVFSSNIGTVKVAQKLGEERLYRYIKRFGFSAQSGIDLPGEVEGILRPPNAWSKSSICAVPIGQEIAVTTLQLASAISCIANGGVLMEPRIVKKIIDSNGVLIKTFEPRQVKRVISKETSSKMKEILRMVVENGTGKRAKVANYLVAGKTGTAQRLGEDGAYSRSKFNSVFIGFAPVDKPKVAIAVVFIEPHPYYYGGTVAAPVFSEIADEVLRYLATPPDISS